MTLSIGPVVRQRSITLFACGNTDRGDDAAAVHAVRAAMVTAPWLEDHVDLRTLEAVDVDDLVGLPDDGSLVVVDALMGPEPGRVVDVDLADLGRSARRLRPTSSHQLPLDRLIGLADVLRQRPLRGRLIGIGVTDVSLGAGLSAVVSTNLPAFTRAIVRAVEELSGPDAAGRSRPGTVDGASEPR